MERFERVKKPEIERYKAVRLIRSGLKRNLFDKIFQAPPEPKLEYVVATINLKKQKLKRFLDTTQVDEFDYK